ELRATLLEFASLHQSLAVIEERLRGRNIACAIGMSLRRVKNEERESGQRTYPYDGTDRHARWRDACGVPASMGLLCTSETNRADDCANAFAQPTALVQNRFSQRHSWGAICTSQRSFHG